MIGIDAVAGYAPRHRITAATIENAWGQYHGAGVSEVAVPDADEDSLTMAYEAASAALGAAGVAPESVSALLVGTTTPPVEEEAMCARLSSMLGVDPAVETRQFTGSTRAGVEALATGLDIESQRPVVVVASDAPRGSPSDAIEHAAGGGAAAVVLSPHAPGAVTDRAEHVAPYPGTRFRPRGAPETTGLGVTHYDRTAFVETVAAAGAALDADLGDLDAIALHSPNGSLPYRAAGALGTAPETIERGTVVHDLGDVGAASPLLGLARALDSGHHDVGVIGYGSGGVATAMAIQGSGVSTEVDFESDGELSYGEYLRIRGDVTPGEPAGGGAYVSVPSWQRTIPQRHRLVAGRCKACGGFAFPPEGACPDCGTLGTYDAVRLPGTGTVEAATVIGQGGAPPEFVEQQARSGAYVSAVVALDAPDEETVSTPAQVIGTDAVAIGDRVEATIRRIYTQEGVTRYGCKMRPIEE
ncbi:MAG: zinc ribbon domain-containing protein [Halobacteriota archaeon]